MHFTILGNLSDSDFELDREHRRPDVRLARILSLDVLELGHARALGVQNVETAQFFIDIVEHLP